MAEFEKFNFKSLEQFKEKILELGIDMDVSGTGTHLGKKSILTDLWHPIPWRFSRWKVVMDYRMGVHPT